MAKFFFRNKNGSINYHAIATLISLFIAAGVLIANVFRGATTAETLFFYPAFVVFLGERIGAMLNGLELSNSLHSSRDSIEKSIDSYSREILSNIRGASEVIKFETFEDAVSSIYRDIEHASEVKNLFIGDRDPIRAMGAQRLAPQQLYKKFLRGENAVEWYDVVGISEVFSTRYRKLNIEGTGAKVKIKVLRHSPPLINFIILKYPSKNGVRNFKEVYFGWIGGIGIDETFFYSSDPELVALFDSERDTLSQTYGWSDESVDAIVVPKGSKSEVQIISGIDIVDKAGWWITCSKNRGNVERYAVFKVVFEGSGTKIIGSVFDSKMNFLNKINHTRAVSHYRDRIHFEYLEENDLDGAIRGTCGYRFHAVGGMPKVAGYITRFDDHIKRDIIGHKLPNYLAPKDADDLDGISSALNAEAKNLDTAKATALTTE